MSNPKLKIPCAVTINEQLTVEPFNNSPADDRLMFCATRQSDRTVIAIVLEPGRVAEVRDFCTAWLKRLEAQS